MNITYVPNPNAADGRMGTGSNQTVVSGSDMDPTYVPNPNEADGTAVATTPHIYEYTGVSPTADGIIPGDPTAPAIAYKRDGSDTTYVWNILLQKWN